MPRPDWYIRANLKLRHLQLLVALDDLGSISRAANLLSITQPAVSKMLQVLESRTGVALFERTPKGMIPTESGRRLIAHAREILLQLSDAKQELDDLKEGRITRISLGVMPAAAVSLVPRFIIELQAHQSGVEVSLREGTVASLTPSLRDGEIDFLVGIMPARPVSEDIQIETLYRDPFVIAVRTGHRLAMHAQAELDWHDLRGYPMVLPSVGALTREMILDMLARHHIVIPHGHVESVSTLTNVSLLTQSDSFALMPFEIASYFQTLDVLAILPIAVPDLYRNVGLMWQPRHSGKSTETVLDIFRRVRDKILPKSNEPPSDRAAPAKQ